LEAWWGRGSEFRVYADKQGFGLKEEVDGKWRKENGAPDKIKRELLKVNGLLGKKKKYTGMGGGVCVFALSRGHAELIGVSRKRVLHKIHLSPGGEAQSIASNKERLVMAGRNVGRIR